jgi:hypothetical protein
LVVVVGAAERIGLEAVRPMGRRYQQKLLQYEFVGVVVVAAAGAGTGWWA